MDYNDIIKGLEICSNNSVGCDGCPYEIRCDDNINALRIDAIEALKCLKAENEKLEVIEDIRTLRKICDEKQSEIERLQQYANGLEDKIVILQRDKVADEKLEKAYTEVDELRRRTAELLSRERALHEAIAALTLEKLGICFTSGR